VLASTKRDNGTPRLLEDLEFGWFVNTRICPVSTRVNVMMSPVRISGDESSVSPNAASSAVDRLPRVARSEYAFSEPRSRGQHRLYALDERRARLGNGTPASQLRRDDRGYPVPSDQIEIVSQTKSRITISQAQQFL
jgi:hypothetical protein